MPDWLTHTTFWDWWVLAALSALVDVFRPAAALRAVALGAGAAGFVLLLTPGLAWPAQWGLAAAASAAAGLGLWAVARRRG